MRQEICSFISAKKFAVHVEEDVVKKTAAILGPSAINRPLDPAQIRKLREQLKGTVAALQRFIFYFQRFERYYVYCQHFVLRKEKQEGYTVTCQRKKFIN